MLRQIMRVIKLLGLRRALKMKRHHDQGLSYIRGYVATTCWWTLLNNGMLEEMAVHGKVDIAEFTQQYPCERKILDAVIEYLHGIGLLDRRDSAVRLSKKGQALFAEPRGLFELLWAYEPCFAHLPALVTGEKKYGRDLTRDVTYVGIGSGRLCEQLPYPVMRRMILKHHCRMVLDLGCGDLALPAGLCRLDPHIRCHGIDHSEQMVFYNQHQLNQNNYQDRLTTQHGDMFNLPTLPADLPPIDAISACDTFHEYLDQPQQIIELLQSLRRQFPDAIFVIGEFCLQDPIWLHKHPTASLEHHLFHQLSNQEIGTADQWRQIFSQAGLEILEEQVYDLIGHGYFTVA